MSASVCPSPHESHAAACPQVTVDTATRAVELEDCVADDGATGGPVDQYVIPESDPATRAAELEDCVANGRMTEGNGHLAATRSRKRIRDQSSWKQNLMKKRGNCGADCRV